MRIETGTFYADSSTPGWGLDKGEGQRIFNGHVDFSQRFNAIPHVIVGLRHLNGGGSAVRVDTQAADVNDDGFTIRFTTWSDSTLWGAAVSWLAYVD